MVKEVMQFDGVRTIVADQCMYGLKIWSNDKRQKDAAAQKKTRFVTNSESISNNLKKKCDGSHKRQELLGGRAAEAAKYPVPLCEAICQGLKEDINSRRKQLRRLMTVTAETKVGKIKEGGVNEINEETHGKEMEDMMAWDDLTGEEVSTK